MNSEWIEINIPWSCNEALETTPMNVEALWARAKSKFGKTRREASESISDELFSEYSSFVGQYENDYPELSNEEVKEVAYLDPKFAPIKEYREFLKEYDPWEDEQPEILAHVAERNAAIEKQKVKSFTGRGLNEPGTLVEIEEEIDNEKKLFYFLIGSINTLGGVCDDCKAFDNGIVRRYKIVWSEDDWKKLS